MSTKIEIDKKTEFPLRDKDFTLIRDKDFTLKDEAIDKETVFSFGNKYFTLEDEAIDSVKLEITDFDESFWWRPRPVIPGREYSNNADKDTSGRPDPGQTLQWFGDGSTNDGFEYPTSGQVDAMANRGDAFFNSVVNNQSSLLFSTTFDDRIHFEDSNGSGGVAFQPGQIDKLHKPLKIDPGVLDVDALELWGPVDANRFSIYGDQNAAVYDYDPVTRVITPLYTQSDIAQAIGIPLYTDLVNIDAMMMSGNKIMFSIDPIEQAGLDGGEIWVWDGSQTPASFLKHGGHTWDTKFPVQKTFNTSSENINALESVGKYHLTIKPGILLKDKDMVSIDASLKEFGDGLVPIDGAGILSEAIVPLDASLKGFGDGLVPTLENPLPLDGDDLIARALG